MVTTTTLLCSKFSPQCLQVIDSLKKQNVSLEPHIKLLWIDNPEVRKYLKQTQIKSVPCIVVHDEDRDISIFYENKRFADYLTNFIQQRRALPPPAIPMGAPHGGPHGGPHAIPMGAPHLASMPQAFHAQNQQFMSSQQNMRNTLQQSQLELVRNQAQQQLPSNDAIRTNLSRQIFGSDQPPKPPSAISNVGPTIPQIMQQKQQEIRDQARKNHPEQLASAMKKAEIENLVAQQNLQQQEIQRQRDYQRKMEEAQQLEQMSMISELKKYPEYSSLSDSDLKVVAQQKLLSHEIETIETAHQRLSNLRQIHSSSPEKVVEIEKELANLSQAKIALAHQRMQLPQIQMQNKMTPVSQQILQQKENYISLQQEKIDSDLSVTKKSQQKNGMTSIDELLGGGEESLYDHHVKRKGTDFHQSESQVSTALSSTKRNSINQKVREMSQTRPVQLEMGIGHEAMAQSSLPTLPDKKPDFTPIDAIDEIDGGEDEDPFGGDLIDTEEEKEEKPEQVVTSALRKKKSTALDMAREMEKGREMLDKGRSRV